ncbi:MAG: class I adenylate cyclase [Cellvibrionaceae bacterium]
MTAPTSHSGQLGLDRHHLHNVRSAFLKLNQARLDLARDSLGELQQIFLDVLPMLFHYNHPMLPGYISRNTPLGLYGFKPSEEQLQQLRRLTRSFQANRDARQQADILSLFSMGSFGTIAQNSKSDIDLWLCHRPDLSRDALLVLEKKCKSISLWAKKLNLEVTIFLMNHQTYHSEKKRDFNHDASGSTQHYLLLDEFYRTAIHLGGQLPAWVFIRSEQEPHYEACQHTLQQQRLLPEANLIDFGTLQQVPAGEFISSAIWQLYKAIDSPYKSILKLLILEIYCQSFEDQTLLSSLFKDQLHAVDRYRIIHHWDVDPYLQTYYFIEDYLLSTQQSQRLEFLRRCFYFKLEQPLTGGVEISTRSGMLLEMTKVWGWDSEYLSHLDNHTRWSLSDVLEERRLIINELNHSYHLIMDFFRTQKISMHASNRELNVLGRKLHAAFSRRAGKIEWVNPLSSKNISEAVLVVQKQSDPALWSAFDIQGNIIAKKSTPVELITWLHCNQVMISASRLCFFDDDTYSTDGDVNEGQNKNFKNYYAENKMDSRLLQSLRRLISSLISLPLKVANHEVFEKGCRLNQLLLFVDYRPDQQHSIYNTSDNIDITRLKCKVDILSINSWNEIICDSKEGALLDTLLEIYMRSMQDEQIDIKTDVLCNHPDRFFQQKIRQTIDTLFKGVLSFFKHNSSGRFISYINGRYLLVHLHDQRSVIKWLSSDDELKSLLSSAMPYYSPIGFDRHTMSHHPLAIFAQEHGPESIQVFYRLRGQQADITLIDEFGTWYNCTMPYLQGRSSLQPLHRFLRAVNERRHDQPATDIGPFDILPITFSEVFHAHDDWRLERSSVSSQVDERAGLSIHAVAECVDKKYVFTFYVDELEFSEVDEGAGVYKRLAAFIKKEQTQHQSISPYYISDLDLSKCRLQFSFTGELNTSHYLMMKTYLEEKIDRALNKIM